MIRNDILLTYRVHKSIKATAKELGISEGVVRKTLISAGMLSTPLIERIRELSASGMPEADIADFLGISVSSVNVNTPYARGTYLDENKSHNAEVIRNWRKQKKEGKP